MSHRRHYFAKFTMSDHNGQPMPGHLHLIRVTPVTESIVRRKVAKTYGIPAASVSVQSIQVN